MNRMLVFMKSAVRWLVLPVLIAVAVLWFKRDRTSEEEASVEYETSTSTELRPVPVEVSEAFMGDLVIRVSATGIVRAFQEVTISPKISGEVVALPVREGTQVQKGDLIFKLDDLAYRLALEEAENALLGAKVKALVDYKMPIEALVESEKYASDLWNVQEAAEVYERVKALHAQGKITRTQLDSARFQYDMAHIFAGKRREDLPANSSGLTQAIINHKKARLNLDYTEVRAPYSGILGNQEVFVGQQVSSGKECFKLVDLSRLRVEANTLESEIGDIEVGRKATVRFAAFPGETFEGKVTAINPIVNSETKTCRVTVEIVNPEHRIKSGMFAFVELEARIHKNRFLVPKDAVLIRDERKLVFVVRDSLAKWCYVESGLENEEFVEVLSSAFDLKPGEPVVVSGHYTLIHDAPVLVKGRGEEGVGEK